MWITIYEYITLWNLFTEYKTRSKMKIKKLLKSKHIVSKNQQNVAEIFAKITYKMILFFSELQKLKTFKNRKFRISIRFRLSNLRIDHLISCNCDENKVLLLRYFSNFRYLFHEFHCFTHTTWSVWFNIRCQICNVYKNLCCMLKNDLLIVVENDNLLWKTVVEKKKCEIARTTKH